MKMSDAPWNYTCKASGADKMLDSVDKPLIESLLNNLTISFNGSEINYASEESWTNFGGTIGWNNALKKTCSENNRIDLMDFYNALAWYDSDDFDADMTDLAIKYGVVTPFEQDGGAE